MSREESRPDALAPTELHPRRERTDEHWPPAVARPNRSNFKDLDHTVKVLERDLEEHKRALEYVEGKADRANLVLDGDPENGNPGLRTLVYTLTEGMKAVNDGVVKGQQSTASMQRLFLLALFVIAASLAWMALRPGPQ